MRYSKDQEAGLKELQEKIKDIKVAMLCTVNNSSKNIHSRPMSCLPSHEENDYSLWFFTYGNSEKTSEIRKDASVNLNYCNEKDGVYISVSGEAEIIDDLDLIKQKWDDSLKTWFADGYHNPQVVLLKVRPTECDFWDFKLNTTGRLFSFISELFGKDKDEEKGNHSKHDFNKI